MTWIKETRQTWADLLFLLEYQTARWDSNIHWLNDFMSICGHAGYNSSCEQPAETNARWCVSVKRLLARCSYFPSLTLRSHTVQLFGLTACQKIFIPSIGKHRFTRAAFQSLALTEKCYQSVTRLRFTRVPTVWKASTGNDLPHTITSFLTHLCFIRNSISAVNFLSPTCFIVDRSWLVLKAQVCFSVQRVQGPALAGGLHHRVYSIYSSSWLSPCVLHLRVRAGVVRRRWFVDILVC